MDLEIVIPDVGAAFGQDKRFAPLVDGDGARGYYRIGYLATAQAAAANLLLRKSGNRSVMPILFLYRHYLELALKDAWHASKAFDLDQHDRKFGHDLQKLWEDVKPVVSGFVVPNSLHTVDALVAFFHDMDKRADAFRYATNRNDTNHFREHGAVNVELLIQEMEKVSAVIENGIDRMAEEERDMDEAIADAVARDRR